ncbi:MAG: type IVB secretion system protein IcmQ [Legionellales bacterium]|nr:type IVB secretion system protein IcmQ [Legionellales bacterium]
MAETIFVKQRRQIIENLDVLIENKDWESSLALKVIQGRIVTYRDSLAQEIDEWQVSSGERCSVTNSISPKLADDEAAIFICLYKNFGDNIQLWERSLVNFSDNVLGRPIYSCEKEAQKFISGKVNREPEGFIEIWVKKDMLISMPPEKTLHDKYGSELLSLKQAALMQEKIMYFTSGVGDKYSFFNNKLVLIEEKQ